LEIRVQPDPPVLLENTEILDLLDRLDLPAKLDLPVKLDRLDLEAILVILDLLDRLVPLDYKEIQDHKVLVILDLREKRE
jgi:hypothetical protein